MAASLTVAPIVGRAMWFPRGHVRITLTAEHRRAYRRLDGMYFPLPDVPPLKDHDFDGRPIVMSKAELAALNRRFLTLQHREVPGTSAFHGQERALTTGSHRTQFLS